MTHTPIIEPAIMDDAVARLLAGRLVAFPTETVYGLAADAGSPEAVARIFALKGRPAAHPVIVHIGSAADLQFFARTMPPAARRLAAALWPGPLTLVLPRASDVGDVVTGGQDTVGLRCPDHPLALALLGACRRAGILGLAAPSANRFGRISPTSAEHVRAEFGTDLLVLDGGPCKVGIESTIVSFSGGRPRILRPGMIDAHTVVTIAGEPLADSPAAGPRVSGSLTQHYAPSTRLELLDAANLVRRACALTAHGQRVAVLANAATLEHIAADHVATLYCAPDQPAAYAHLLYAALRTLDESNAAVILVERPPVTVGWEAIHDRLKRAAAGAGHAE